MDRQEGDSDGAWSELTELFVGQRHDACHDIALGEYRSRGDGGPGIAVELITETGRGACAAFDSDV